MRLPTAAALCLLGSHLFAANAASAQTVWRCGADGRSYSSTPCEAGVRGRAIDVGDSRSAADVQAAQQAVQRDRQLAAQMARDRRERERETHATVGNGLAAMSPAPRAEAPALRAELERKKHLRPHRKQPTTRRATAPAA
jgi:hypothetical protein